MNQTQDAARWAKAGGPVTRQTNARRYLMSLVRMDIRKKERELAKFAPRPEQSIADAERVRREFEDNLAYRRLVLATLQTEEKAAHEPS